MKRIIVFVLFLILPIGLKGQSDSMDKKLEDRFQILLNNFEQFEECEDQTGKHLCASDYISEDRSAELDYWQKLTTSSRGLKEWYENVFRLEKLSSIGKYKESIPMIRLVEVMTALEGLDEPKKPNLYRRYNDLLADKKIRIYLFSEKGTLVVAYFPYVKNQLDKCFLK